MTSDDLKPWFREWIAPPTLIALIAFAGITAVAHYRLSQVEQDVATIQLDMERQKAANAEVYSRRDVLAVQLSAITEQLTLLNRRLEGIEGKLGQNNELTPAARR